MSSLRNRTSSRRSSRIPNSVQCGDPGLSRKYFTRKPSSKIRTNDLPMEPNHLGFHSPWAFLWFFLFLVAPLAYIYIALMLLRDLCEYFPETIQQPLDVYLPSLAKLTTMMKSYNGFRLVDVWCIIEAVFFICYKLKIRYLQAKDPLEACLSAAPMLDAEERKSLWERIMAVETEPSWIREWFLDHPELETISLYDIYDFVCWALFDGRNQEHLTTHELNDLEGFVEDLEYRISLQLYGAIEEEGCRTPTGIAHDRIPSRLGVNESTRIQNLGRNRTFSDDATASETDMIETFNYDVSSVDETKYDSPLKFPQKSRVPIEGETPTSIHSGSWSSFPSIERPRPKQLFRFRRDIEREGPNYFSDLYESYKVRYERYRNMIENADFHPVQDLRNLVAETAQHAGEIAHSAEESALKSAQNMYETIIQPGSQMDKRLSALGHATQIQLTEAWNSVKGMKERLETANFLSERRAALLKQVRGNRAMLTRMREMSYAVNSKQMAALMRKITESYEALENIEVAAREGFLSAAGKIADNSLFKQQEPRRYARYSSDPILGIATCPLSITVFLLGATEMSLRIMMKRRGFERRYIGPVSYYYHPGSEDGFPSDDANTVEPHGMAQSETPQATPVIYIHGIGVGLIAYIPLIDALLESGRPLFLPELPFVSAFRPWQSSRNVLSPAVVASTMTAMLAYHGFSKGTFMGHSYGTSWLSYVCKYAHSAVAALLFLDPICFCLYHPHLTKSFVYHRADPGSIAFVVRTDMMVNWTIQRAFPWTWIVLFLDQINVPCTIFLSEEDALVPTEKVVRYLRSNGVPVSDASAVDRSFFEEKGDLKSCVWEGACHGGFTEKPELVPDIIVACNALCDKVEGR